jgi:uncharacterized protein with von Willebrand factor type A (vWA) domain
LQNSRISGRRIAAAAVMLTFVGGVLGGCGSSAPSASEKVCNDRAALKSAVSTAVTDLRAGNFGEARTHLSGISDAFTRLQKSAQDLKAEESEALRPQIDEVTTTLSKVTSSQSLTQLRTNLDTLGNQIGTLSTHIASTLKCS